MRSLGLDLGNVVFKKGELIEGSLEVIKQLVPKFFNAYIVSRVNSEQKERSWKALESVNFFDVTGIPQDNLYYCFERRDKAIFQTALHIDVFIDDRYDCLFPMDKYVKKILFNPSTNDLQKYKDNKPYNMLVVSNWSDIGRYFKINGY